MNNTTTLLIRSRISVLFTFLPTPSLDGSVVLLISIPRIGNGRGCVYCHYRIYLIINHRFRIGHLFLTHGLLLREKTCPRCSVCGVHLTVEHILLHCVSFAIARDHSFNMTVTTLSELFSKVSSRSVIEFIKKTELCHKI